MPQDNYDGMTVAELIEKLKAFDPDKRVKFCDYDEGVDKEINGVFEDDGEVYVYEILPYNK